MHHSHPRPVIHRLQSCRLLATLLHTQPYRSGYRLWIPMLFRRKHQPLLRKLLLVGTLGYKTPYPCELLLPCWHLISLEVPGRHRKTDTPTKAVAAEILEFSSQVTNNMMKSTDTRSSAMAEGPHNVLVSIETRVPGLSCGIICTVSYTHLTLPTILRV